MSENSVLTVEEIQKNLAEGENIRLRQRLERGFGDFVSGNVRILLNIEFANNFVAFLIPYFKERGAGEARALLRVLGRGSQSSDEIVRERAVKIIAMLLAESKSGEIDLSTNLLSSLLVGWLENEEKFLDGFPTILNQIELTAVWLIERKNWEDAWYLLFTLRQIKTGVLVKSAAIRGLIAQTLDAISLISVLQHITDAYVVADPIEEKRLQNMLYYLGKRAVVSVTNRLIHSQNKAERLRLSRLLGQWGKESEGILLDCLRKKPVWYVVRNIINILGEIDRSGHIATVMPYMRHPDMRVQMAALEFLSNLPAAEARGSLLKILPEMPARTLPLVLPKLAAHDDPAVAEAFLTLLADSSRYDQPEFVEIFDSLLTPLKKYPNGAAVSYLRRIAALPGDNDRRRRIALLAQDALRLMEPRLRHIARGGSATDVDYAGMTPEERRRHSMEKLRLFNDEVNFLLQKKETIRVTEKIANRCVEAAREKDFDVAEMLRDRLLEINPYALNEVIRIGEIIEEERASSITYHHLEVWADLYEMMSTEEFNAIYYASRREKYADGETIVREGEIDAKLYFINSGQVDLLCRAAGGDTFLKRMKPGEIHGAEQFFGTSVWTTTMKAHGDAEIQYLEQQVLIDIEEKFHGVTGKLRDFCERQSMVPSLLQMSGADRRDSPRYPVSLRVVYVFTDVFSVDEPRRYTADLVDISVSGLCLSVRISGQDKARLLLGRRVSVDLSWSGEPLRLSGSIVGVRYLDVANQDYTLHISLVERVSENRVRWIVEKYGVR
ncbi:MAG: cyclic nucleotide-binding domain-containing protein [Desulfobulbaceae bacterium]|jgi:CRP-like cAMP-binding protein|nr:cyclic nucleotide-binding domain-containing protein [Desulfobulbaceae bacterium]